MGGKRFVAGALIVLSLGCASAPPPAANAPPPDEATLAPAAREIFRNERLTATRPSADAQIEFYDGDHHQLTERQVVERYDRELGEKPSGYTRWDVMGAGALVTLFGAGATVGSFAESRHQCNADDSSSACHDWNETTIVFGAVTIVGIGVTIWAPFMPSASEQPGRNYTLQSDAQAQGAVDAYNRALFQRLQRESTGKTGSVSIRVTPTRNGIVLNAAF